MTEQKKRLSRREAIKILGTATGASLLANIPSKWSKPELSGGAIPAHAQTSICGPDEAILSINFGNVTTSFGSAYLVYQSVAPDAESGTPYRTGYNLYWCRPQCIFYIAEIENGLSTGSMDLNVTIRQPGGSLTEFLLHVDRETTGVAGAWIYLNGSTGDHTSGVYDSTGTNADVMPSSFSVTGCPTITRPF